MEKADLVKFKDNYIHTEKQHMVYKTDYEIIKRSLDTLQDEMKKTKEKIISTENDNKKKERTIKDLNEKVKDFEIKMNIKENQIHDLELKNMRYSGNTNMDENMLDAENPENGEENENGGDYDSGNLMKDSQKKNDKVVEEMMNKLNEMNNIIENQKASHKDQITKLTEKIDELRRDNNHAKKENEGLRVQINEMNMQTNILNSTANSTSDENSILNEMLQKSIELENNLRRYKIKSDELSLQLIRDREYYNTNISVLYSIVTEKHN